MKGSLRMAVGFAFAVWLAVPAPAQDLASQLAGLWKYTGATVTEVGSGKVTKPFGEKPSGYAVYTKGGKLVFVVVGDNRTKPAGAAVTDTEAITLFRTLGAGSGTYKLDGTTITYTYDSSWNQAWTGTSQKRKIEMAGNKLTVTSDPFKAPGTGLDVVLATTFEKVE